jgi:hypothetical protein
MVRDRRSTIIQSFPQSVTGIEIEDRLNLGRCFIGKIDEISPARHGHQHRCGALLNRKLDKVEWVMDCLDRPAKIQPADNREPARQRHVEKRRAERRQRRNTEIRSTLSRVKGPELHTELVFGLGGDVGRDRPQRSVPSVVHAHDEPIGRRFVIGTEPDQPAGDGAAALSDSGKALQALDKRPYR